LEFLLWLPGQVIVGNCVSLTVTVKLQVTVFDDASVTLNVLVVTPTGNEDPLGSPAICIVDVPGQLSVPTGVLYVTIALHKPFVLLTDMLAGQLMVGNWLSLTVTLKLHVVVLAEASVTLKVLMVVPTGKEEPLANPAICVVTAPAQLSVPTGVL
jgi:hypothetical protein